MLAIFQIILMLLGICWWLALALVIMSWLISFNIVNTRNEFVANIWRLLTALTEPILKPIRRIIPPVAGFDLSVLALFILINIADIIVRNMMYSMLV